MSSAALAVALVHVKGRRSGLATLPALAVALPELVLYRFAFELNQWSFSTAIFQMVTLLVCWERLGENLLMNTLLALSAAVVHPLVIPVLILGIFLAGRGVRTGGFRSPGLPVVSLVLLAAFLLLPSLGAQKVRALEGYGPVLWVDGMAVLIVGIAYSLALLFPSGLKGFRGTANQSFFWASLAGVVASWGLGLTPYWISKYLYLSFFLVAAGTDHGLVRRLGERLQSGLAMVVLVSVLWMIAKFSQSAVFGENDMALAKILATSENSKARVYVLADPYRMAWLQSFVYPTRLLRPENFRRLAVSFANRADPPSFLAIFKELGSSGDHLWTLFPDEVREDEQFRFETGQFGWTQFVYQGTTQP